VVFVFFVKSLLLSELRLTVMARALQQPSRDFNSTSWRVPMTCEEVMTPSPTCCRPEQTAVEAAELMQREDVGLVPVVSGDKAKLIGVLTDRDIVLKVVAAGRDPRGTSVSEVMTNEPITCLPQESVESVMELMATRQVRRIPIVDKDGSIVGIVAQADIATRLGTPEETGQVVQAISEPATT
jgi:CBS domain-containing protein